MSKRQTPETDALIIGAGPAGLMAADALSAAGHRVLIADRMPSPARKLLMAGKSGLNITREEALPDFAARYGTGAGPIADMLREFGPTEVMDWTRSLGREVFTGSTGHVFPVEMKASPLLRAWLARLADRGVEMRTRWHWTGGGAFDTPDGPVTVATRATVLAMGGASWARLGSNGAWAETLARDGLPLAPFAPANAGLSIAWSAHMAPHLGQPLKNVALIAGAERRRGECVLAATGLEGSGVYAISRAVREGAPLHIDLKPDWTEARVRDRLASAKGSLSNRLRKGLRLDPAQVAIFMAFARTVDDPAAAVKALSVAHDGLRPLDEAISTAGGLQWDALDANLMLRDRPGTFACGEMLDWEAPTGGYLLTACLATGRHAGLAAARWLDAQTG